MLGRVRRRIDGWLTARLSKIHDGYALNLLDPLRGEFGYLPWPRSAMRPGAICHALNEILINRRQTVLEFGAGISTVFFAAVLSEAGGNVLTIDEDAEWARHVNDLLASKGLDSCADVHHVPLALEGEEPWYHLGLVKEALRGRRFDFLVVDGPKACVPSRSRCRRPALQSCREFMNQDFCVLLDDIGREGERDIFFEYERLLGVEGQRCEIEGGHGMICVGPRFFTSI